MFIRRTDPGAVFAFLLAIETDPDRMPEDTSGRPGLLSQGDADQMLAHLAADLRTLLPEARNCHLAATGALFDQCQVLRPGTPIFAALADSLPQSAQGESASSLTAIGARRGEMSNIDLQPDPGLRPGLLQLLPMVASGPEALMDSLAEEMEHRFLAEGQVSAHTAAWMESAFGIGAAHARFMTLTDLNAMFRLQLENFGFLPLWKLIDAAIGGHEEEMTVTTEKGGEYRWREGCVRAVFETFDHWSNHGPGRAVSAQGDALTRGYAGWNREFRQFGSTLAAHHVPLRIDLPEACVATFEAHYLFEEVDVPDVPGSYASVTEHSWPDLGVIAITARTAQSLRHYYPLTPLGLNEIHQAVQDLELSGEGLSFAGRIEHDRDARSLQAAEFD